MSKQNLGRIAVVVLALIGVFLLFQKGNQVRSTIIGFEQLGVEGTLLKGLRFNLEDTMGRVRGLDLHLVDVEVDTASA